MVWSGRGRLRSLVLATVTLLGSAAATLRRRDLRRRRCRRRRLRCLGLLQRAAQVQLQRQPGFPRYIQAGSVNDTPFNHFSALRSYEDLLGIDEGGADGHGHLGFAAQAGLDSFGGDVFNRRPDR